MTVDGNTLVLGTRKGVLVIEEEDTSTGLVVDEVFGMRHFFDEEKVNDTPPVSERLGQYMTGAYRQGERHWGILSMRNLVESEDFKNASARG